MATINVQFSDSAKTAIIGYFGSPQDPEYFPNMGAVADTDSRWETFYSALPPWAQDGLPAPVGGAS